MIGDHGYSKVQVWQARILGSATEPYYTASPSPGWPLQAPCKESRKTSEFQADLPLKHYQHVLWSYYSTFASLTKTFDRCTKRNFPVIERDAETMSMFPIH